LRSGVIASGAGVTPSRVCTIWGKTMGQGRGKAHKTTGESLAICALSFYLITEMVFYCDTLLTTYPNLAACRPREICEAASMAMAISAIALRPRVVSRGMLLLIAVSAPVVLAASIETGDYRLAHGYVFLVAVAGISPARIGRVYYSCVLPIVILVVLLSIVGLLYNKDVIPNSRIVFSFGFGHPNALGAILFSTMSAMVYACWRERSWGVSVVATLTCAGFCYLCLSSHASAVALLLLAVAALVGHTRILSSHYYLPRRLFQVVMVAVPAILLALMLVGLVFFDADNPFFARMNSLLHGRLYYSNMYYLDHDGLSVFGRQFIYAGSYHNGLPFGNVDSGYCYLALVYGLAALCAVAVVYIAAVQKLSFSRPTFPVLAIVLISAMYLLLESYALYPMTSFASLLIAEAFASDGKNAVAN